MRKLVRILPVVAIMWFLAGPFAQAQDEDFGPPNRQDLLSGGSTLPDTTATSPGPSSPSGTMRRPRVGPNVQVNSPQRAFPKGLLGRSETTIAATPDGQNLLVGFNDAHLWPAVWCGLHARKPGGTLRFCFLDRQRPHLHRRRSAGPRDLQ